MRAMLHFLLVIVLVLATALPASARKKKGHTPTPVVHKRSDAEIEAATRLQVFLDRANFSPGKIDGHYNDFTLKALALYRQSRGEPVAPRPSRADTAPDLNGIDLGSVGPVFIQYTVTDADMKNIGLVPPVRARRSRRKKRSCRLCLTGTWVKSWRRSSIATKNFWPS